MSKEPASKKPDALTAEPREIVAVYEARREMEALDAIAIERWEKEKAKKKGGEDNGKEETGRYEAWELGRCG